MCSQLRSCFLDIVSQLARVSPLSQMEIGVAVTCERCPARVGIGGSCTLSWNGTLEGYFAFAIASLEAVLLVVCQSRWSMSDERVC